MFSKKKKNIEEDPFQNPTVPEDGAAEGSGAEGSAEDGAAEEANEADKSKEAETPGRVMPLLPETVAGEHALQLEALISSLRSELAEGSLSPGTLGILLRGITYGADLERAEAEAMIRGRNEAFSERMRSFEESDGLPHPSCGHGAPTRRSAQSIFDMARAAR